MLGVVALSVLILNVVMLSLIMPSVAMLGAVMLIVKYLSVLILNVTVPKNGGRGLAEAYPSEAPFWCSTLGLAPGLTHKQ